MTEAEARGWIAAHFGAEREAQLARFVEMLIAEASEQNLISAATMPEVWQRHIVDSAQLVNLASGAATDDWIDIGTGAGLPGLVVAILQRRPVLMIEPRRRRVEFLQSCIDALGLQNAEIAGAKVERVNRRPAAIISARAVAALPQLLASSAHLSNAETLWLLPKGVSAQSEVAQAKQTWQGSFHVEPSITHPDSKIIVARGIAR